jgi:DNA-binding cell septation regulator SpoVG
MNKTEISVEIRLFAKPNSPVRAYADVSLEVPGGNIVIIGFAIVRKEGKPLFVGFPSKPGTIQGKYFPVVDLQGDVRELVCKAILDAYAKHIKN